MSRVCPLILAALAAGAAASATSAPPAEINLFGDGIEQKLKLNQVVRMNGIQVIVNGKTGTDSEKPRNPGHTLVLHDGRQIRGQVVALNKDEVAWRRPGVNEPLRFARDEVQRIVLAEQAEGANSVIEPPDANSPDHPSPAAASPAATIKLGGGDWLFGDVTSTDGQIFLCRLGTDATFKIPRSQIAWLYDNTSPAPAFSLSGAGLTGWQSNNGLARVEAVDGTMTVKEAAWFGRVMELPTRFEVSFEVPATVEDGTRLWLQPYGLQPNSFSPGTITLRLGPEQMMRQIFINGFAQKTVKIPKDPAGKQASYRVLYDGESQRLVVLRNGEPLGDWKFGEEIKNAKAAQPRSFAITGVCFDRDDQGEDRGLSFNRLEVRPWNGLVPKSGEPAPAGDVLNLSKESPRAGKLEALSKKDLVLSGTTLARAPGMFVQFPQSPAVPPSAAAVLNFGVQGELSVTAMDIRDGKANCRTVFAENFAIPVARLQTITFPPHAATPMTGDLLVFKNGDELPGTLLSATSEGPLRWRTARGQEVEVQMAQAAGVLFAAVRKIPPTEERATVELRNGDRLLGTFVDFDGTGIQFRQKHLGAIKIDRDRIWRLYPNPQFAVRDGSCDLEAWLGKDRPPGGKPPEDIDTEGQTVPWLYLDGHYVLRAPGTASGSYATSMLQSAAGGAMERFEVRFDIAQVGEDQPGFDLQFSGKDGGSSVQASFSDGELRIFVANGNAQNGMNQREVSINDKLTEPTTRLNVRTFVNTKVGTLDFFIDGMPVAKVGQNTTERLPGIGATTVLQAQASSESPLVVSDVWIGPWNGELPRADVDAEPAMALTNGDVAKGRPTAWSDGKISFESDIGPLEIPLTKVLSIDFGGELAPERARARIHLPDGSTLNLDRFRWDGRELTAYNATMGDLHLPPEAFGELVFDPPPAHPPRTPPAKKLAQKTTDGPDE